MANLFKRAARAFGRLSGRRVEAQPVVADAEQQMTLIEPVVAELPTEGVEPIDELIEKSGQVPPLEEGTVTTWEAILESADPVAVTATLETPEAVEVGEDATTFATGEPIETATDTTLTPIPAPEEAATVAQTVAAPSDETTTPVTDVQTVTVLTDEAATPVAETAAVAQEEAPAAEVAAPIAAPAVATVEAVTPPIEMKPEPAPRPDLSFDHLYDLISTEVDKRSRHTVSVYERLLAATRDELDATRRNNRLAWSVGGVMSAVAAFGAIWSSGEVAATHTEVAALKQQVGLGQQVSIERDQLRNELFQTHQVSAKVEIDALKARLDQALAVSTERDRLRGELDVVRKARQEVESELRVARAAAATQPVSDARRFLEKTTAHTTVAATAGDKAAGAERPDVWSSLLNGRD